MQARVVMVLLVVAAVDAQARAGAGLMRGVAVVVAHGTVAACGEEQRQGEEEAAVVAAVASVAWTAVVQGNRSSWESVAAV